MSTNKIDVNVYDNMLDYFKGLIDNDKYCVAFIERFYNTIIYGSYNNGFKEEESDINKYCIYKIYRSFRSVNIYNDILYGYDDI